MRNWLCEAEAIVMEWGTVKINEEHCILCETCIDYCPVSALVFDGREQSMKEVDVIIIGAGAGGLCAGALLANAGNFPDSYSRTTPLSRRPLFLPGS